MNILSLVAGSISKQLCCEQSALGQSRLLIAAAWAGHTVAYHVADQKLLTPLQLVKTRSSNDKHAVHSYSLPLFGTWLPPGPDSTHHALAELHQAQWLMPQQMPSLHDPASLSSPTAQQRHRVRFDEVYHGQQYCILICTECTCCLMKSLHHQSFAHFL